MFFSMWMGSGLVLQEEYKTLFNYREDDVDFLEYRKQIPFRMGLSLGIYL
jgi:hypothetical protein